MPTILLLALIGSVLSAITGTFWYSGLTPMGAWHMQYLGFDKLSKAAQAKKIEEAKPHMWKTYLMQLGLSFLTSLFIGSVTWYTVQNGGQASAVYYYVPMIWGAFTVPMIGQNLLWGNTSGGLAIKKFLSDSIYNLLTYLLIAFVATMLVG